MIRYDMHPERERRRVDTDSEVHDPIENGFLRCKRCGFVMNKRNYAKSTGEGNTYITSSYTLFVGYGAGDWGTSAWGGEGLSYYGDPTASSGCPLCGTYNYD